MTLLGRLRFLGIAAAVVATALTPALAYQRSTFSGVVASSAADRIRVTGHQTNNKGGAPVTLTFIVGPDFTGITNSDGSTNAMKLQDIQPGTQVTVTYYAVTVQTGMKLIGVKIFNGLNIPLNVH